jgi:hypothetical protein
MQKILFESNTKSLPMREDDARRLSMSKRLYKKYLQEKNKLKDPLVELRKSLREALFEMKNARGFS